MRKNKLLLLLALLMTAATGAWAVSAVASIGSENYTTLQAAFTAAETGQTIKLLSDVTQAGGVGKDDGKAVTFDLNGHIYTCTDGYGVIATDNSQITIIDSSTGTPGGIKSESALVSQDNGKIIIKAGRYNIDALTAEELLEYFPLWGVEMYSGYTLQDITPADAQGFCVGVVAPTYTVALKDGVKDADKWTVKVGEGQAQALPIGGLKGDGSETVTLQYNGRLKVKGVTATSDAAPAEEPVTLATPLTVEAVTPGTIRVNINGTLYSGMKYSVNGGTKTTITETTTIEGLKAGDKVQFYGNGTQTQAYGDSPEVRIEGSGDGFQTKAYGNIMSLLDEEGFATKTDLPNNTKFVFYGLFRGNSTLIDASELLLPATTLTEACYSSMFKGCTSLTTAPKLPATTLPANCYYGMFYGCTSLTSAYVKAAYIDDSNDSMFNDCTATGAVLHTAPGSKASWEFMMGTDKPWDNWTVAGDWEE